MNHKDAISYERGLFLRGQKRLIDQTLKRTIRSPITRSRTMESNIDTVNLPIMTMTRARVTKKDLEENSELQAEPGDFWFVWGYSEVGGPDIIRE